jgi:DNA-binding FadR family transcriptional regulator
MPTPAATRDVLRPAAGSNAKRAAKVADRIVDDVMARGWPLGHVLGSEAQLLERYQVSRAVFREAVRLVENKQVVRTRRGPGGGLVVTEPTVGAVSDAVVLYLHRVDTPLDEIFEARVVLEELACELAAGRADAEDRVRLRRFEQREPTDPGEDPRELHKLIASISRNAGLDLFVDVFNQVAHLYSPDWQRLGAAVRKETQRAHEKIAAALIAGEGGLAANRMRKHLQAEADFFRRRRSTRQLLPDSVVLGDTGGSKGAEVVARDITQLIVERDLRPGELVGSEPELIAREGVSRALLREAVRLLEHHHIARMRRGPGGGLFVMAASVSAVTDVAAIYLARRGMELGELADMRTGVEVTLADLAAQRIDADGVDGLHEALEHEKNTSDAERAEAVGDLHAAVAAAAHNRALQLVALVLIRLSRLHQIERLAPSAREKVKAEVLCTHEGIAEAIQHRDRDLARQRMRRHQQAVAALMG